MISILDLLPILTIFSIGAVAWKGITLIFPTNMRKTELYNIFLVCGTIILVFPLMLIGIQKEGAVKIVTNTISITIINFQGWSLLYFVVGLILAIILGYKLVRKLLANLENYQFRKETFTNYQTLLLTFLLLDYLFIQFVLPLRGFDAFYYYFPEAEIFYQANRITEINYLSFLPVTKSPLNVLLYVYSLYTTGELAIQLLPFIFLVGIVFLVYDFALEFFDNKSLARTAAIFTLTLPLVYWLINYWAFYQDLYLCFFFSASCYFSWKWYKNPSNHGYAILIAFAIINTILSKITGWVLLIILLLWIPTQTRHKHIRLCILIILGIFLCIQAATRIYIGVILPVLIAFILTGFLIVKEHDPITPRKIISFSPMIFGVALGGTWLLDRMSLSTSVWDEISNLYFKVSQSIIWTYPTQPQDPLLFTLENVHKSNFISASGFLFLSSAFVLPWAFLKISALADYKKISPLLIWVLVFFGIWSAYYLNSSNRYLVPIIVPIILIITWGSHQFFQKLRVNISNELYISILAFMGCFNFYYLISSNSFVLNDQTQVEIGKSYNQAALSYYTHPEILLIQIVIFTSIMLLVSNKNRMIPSIQKMKKLSNLKPYRVAFIIVIIIPIAVQSYLLIYTQGNFKQFYSIHEYEYRSEYQEIVEVIQQQNQPLAGIMTVRTPGLQFFLKQPVLDIYYQNYIFQGNPFFKSTNLTELINILHHPLNYTSQITIETNYTLQIRYIIVPSPQNIYYSIYINEIEINSFLFRSLENNTQIFKVLFLNSDFKIFEITF